MLITTAFTLSATLISTTIAAPATPNTNSTSDLSSQGNTAVDPLTAPFLPIQSRNIQVLVGTDLGDKRDAADVTSLWLSFIRRLWVNPSQYIPDNSFQSPEAAGEWVRWTAANPRVLFWSQELGPASVFAIATAFGRARPGDKTLPLNRFIVKKAGPKGEKIGTVEASARLLGDGDGGDGDDDIGGGNATKQDTFVKGGVAATTGVATSKKVKKREGGPTAASSSSSDGNDNSTLTVPSFRLPAREDQQIRSFVQASESDFVPPKFLIGLIGDFIMRNVYPFPYTKKLSSFLSRPGLVHQVIEDFWALQIFVEDFRQGATDVTVGHVEQALRALIAHPDIKGSYRAFESRTSLVDGTGGLGSAFLRVEMGYTDKLPPSLAPIVPWLAPSLEDSFGGIVNGTDSSLQEDVPLTS